MELITVRRNARRANLAKYHVFQNGTNTPPLVRTIVPTIFFGTKESTNQATALLGTTNPEEITRRPASDAKALYASYCALSVSKINRISSCTIAEEIWDRIQVTFEETDRVRDTKMNILLGKYKSF